MQKILHTIVLLLLLTTATTAQVSIVPKPVSLIAGNKTLQWKKPIDIVATTADEKKIAALLQEFFKTKNIQSSVLDASAEKIKISLSTINDASLGKEGYKLFVNGDGIQLQANAGAGLFYGLQSLLQIAADDGKSIP